MRDPVNTCRIVTGRLVEIDVAAGYRTVADIDQMMTLIARTTAAAPDGGRLVIAADWRPCDIFTPAVADRAVQMLTAPHMKLVARSAILHRAEAATSVMQVFRLVREAQFPHRKVFTEPSEMEAWLGEELDDAERARLRAFLVQRS